MNIFKQLFKSIYSPKDIAAYRFQGMGKTIFYVFLLTFISVLPSIFFFSSTLSNGLNSAHSLLEEETPSFSIQNGQLSAKTDVPVTVQEGNFTFILDPTGAVTEKDVGDEGNAFAILKSKFVISAGGQTDAYSYSMMEGLNISKSDLIGFVDNVSKIKNIIIPIFSVFIYLFSSVSLFIEVSVLALLGLILKNLAGKKVTYGQLWKMSAYSETLPTLFFTIMAILKTSVPNSFWINWIVLIIMLYLAINEIPKLKKTV